jgi:hypothetical protein
MSPGDILISLGTKVLFTIVTPRFAVTLAGVEEITTPGTYLEESIFPPASTPEKRTWTVPIGILLIVPVVAGLVITAWIGGLNAVPLVWTTSMFIAVVVGKMTEAANSFPEIPLAGHLGTDMLREPVPEVGEVFVGITLEPPPPHPMRYRARRALRIVKTIKLFFIFTSLVYCTVTLIDPPVGVGVDDGVGVGGIGVKVGVADIIVLLSLPQPTNVTDAKETNNETNNRAAQIVINHFFI